MPVAAWADSGQLLRCNPGRGRARPGLFFCLLHTCLTSNVGPMDFANLLIQLLNSLQYGLLLFMLAAGLTLIFGVLGVVNLAHGSFYMLGAYLAWLRL